MKLAGCVSFVSQQELEMSTVYFLQLSTEGIMGFHSLREIARPASHSKSGRYHGFS